MFKDLNSSNTSYSTISTTSVDYIVPEFQRLTVTEQSITYIGPTICNTITLQIRQSRTLSLFKDKYKQELLFKYF